MRTNLHILLLALATCVAFGDRAQAQFGPRLTTTRVNMAHGRVQTIREVGIFSTDNRRGNPVPGAKAIMDLIAGMSDPFLVTLDLNQAGNAPRDMNAPAPILLTEAKNPLASGMTLIVAEGAGFCGWKSLATRFSDGNLYATVSIPAKKIFAGMELVTFQHFQDYTANSIFFEAPDFGFFVMKNNNTGGSTTVSAQYVDKKYSLNFGFAAPLHLTLSGTGSKRTKEKTATLVVTATLPTAFESPCLIRYAAQSSKETIVEQVVFAASPNDRRSSFRSRRIVINIKADIGESVAISAVASPGPFLEPLPARPQSVGLKTFQSKGSTLEDTLSIQITKAKTPLDQQYMAWLNDVGWIHVGTVKEFKSPRTKGSEIWGGRSSELMKYTPLFGGRTFEEKDDAIQAVIRIVGSSAKLKVNVLASPTRHYASGDRRIGFEIVDHPAFARYKAAADARK